MSYKIKNWILRFFNIVRNLLCSCQTQPPCPNCRGQQHVLSSIHHPSIIDKFIGLVAEVVCLLNQTFPLDYTTDKIRFLLDLAARISGIVQILVNHLQGVLNVWSAKVYSSSGQNTSWTICCWWRRWGPWWPAFKAGTCWGVTAGWCREEACTATSLVCCGEWGTACTAHWQEDRRAIFTIWKY